MAVLILSHDEDPHVQEVVAELDKFGYPWVRFDPRDALRSPFRITTSIGGTTTTLLSFPHDLVPFDLGVITSVWNRRPSSFENGEADTVENAFIKREGTAGIWGALRALPVFWINHPDAVDAAKYKVQQLQVATSLGLTIPDTLITNDPEQFVSFYHAWKGHIVFKLMGYPVYRDHDHIPLTTYTRVVPPDMLHEAHRVSRTMHFFQQYIDKAYDLRIIVIGDQVFSTEIHALSEETHIDFRRDYSRLKYVLHDLPMNIAKQLLALNQHYGLHYSAIDMVCDNIIPLSAEVVSLLHNRAFLILLHCFCPDLIKKCHGTSDRLDWHLIVQGDRCTETIVTVQTDTLLVYGERNNGVLENLLSCIAAYRHRFGSPDEAAYALTFDQSMQMATLMLSDHAYSFNLTH